MEKRNRRILCPHRKNVLIKGLSLRPSRFKGEKRCKKEKLLEEGAFLAGLNKRFRVSGLGKDLCTYLLKNRGASFSPSGLFKNPKKCDYNHHLIVCKNKV